MVGKEVVEPETIDGFFCERLNLFAGGALLEGLDMSNLVVAGGAVLAALTLGDATDANVSRDAARAVLRDARETTSDVDLFVVADSDAQAQAVYQRVLRHFAARIAGGCRSCRMASRRASTYRPTRSASSCSSCGRQRRSPSSPATRSATFSSSSGATGASAM